MSTDSQHDPQAIQEAIRNKYSQLKVGLTLMVFILVAVTAEFFPYGSTKARNIGVCVAVAINVFLVTAVSMHLKTEKKTITHFLVFTVIFILFLFALTALAFFDSTGHRH